MANFQYYRVFKPANLHCFNRTGMQLVFHAWKNVLKTEMYTIAKKRSLTGTILFSYELSATLQRSDKKWDYLQYKSAST